MKYGEIVFAFSTNIYEMSKTFSLSNHVDVVILPSEVEMPKNGQPENNTFDSKK